MKRTRTQGEEGEEQEIQKLYKSIFDGSDLETFEHNLNSLKQAKKMIEDKISKLLLTKISSKLSLSKIPQEKVKSSEFSLISSKTITDFFHNTISSQYLLEKIVSCIESLDQSCHILSTDFFLNIRTMIDIDPDVESILISKIQEHEYLIFPILEETLSIALVDNNEHAIEYYTYDPQSFDKNCQIVEEIMQAAGITEKYEWQLMEVPEFVNCDSLMTWTLFALANNLELSDYSEDEFIEYISRSLRASER